MVQRLKQWWPNETGRGMETCSFVVTSLRQPIKHKVNSTGCELFLWRHCCICFQRSVQRQTTDPETADRDRWPALLVIRGSKSSNSNRCGLWCGANGRLAGNSASTFLITWFCPPTIWWHFPDNMQNKEETLKWRSMIDGLENGWGLCKVSLGESGEDYFYISYILYGIFF